MVKFQGLVEDKEKKIIYLLAQIKPLKSQIATNSQSIQA